MSIITLIKCILLECREGEEEMKTLLGYENSLCRDFIRDHLTVMAPEMHIMVAGTNRECLQLAAESSQLSVVGLDTEMLDMDGVTGLRQMIAQCAGLVPVALIGPFRGGSDLRDYLAAGASGYLPYSLGTDALLAALQMVAAGEVYVPVEMMAADSPITPRSQGWLTGRERDVLNGLLSGQSNKEIARKHGLSEVTIKHHLKSLRSKLGARNRTHAVCRAIELGVAEDSQVVA